MKKPYQIGAGRAVQRVRQWAEEENPAVQLMLPMIEILALAKQGAGELVREVGIARDLAGDPEATGKSPSWVTALADYGIKKGLAVKAKTA
jgi:hypothetical protein